MTLHVLVGPSLSADTVRSLAPNAEIHPPAEYGSIYKLIDSSCSQILLIDGLFFYNISVWHREIIAALDSGIEVFGCSSMGALRAVELSTYGMVGIGRVYDFYKSGLIDGDDEVAVMHGSQEDGYSSFTVPLVTLRWNLNLMKQKKLISNSEMETIIALVKQLPFHNRSWYNILDVLKAEKHFSSERIQELKSTLAVIWQDIKELDARDALISLSNQNPKKNLTTTLKNDYPQPDYISHAIKSKLKASHLAYRNNNSRDFSADCALDLVCIMSFIAPLVISPINQNNFSFSPELNFLSRKGEEIAANMQCVSTSILSMSNLTTGKVQFDDSSSVTDEILDMVVSLGYLCLISGMSIECDPCEQMILPFKKQDLYNIGLSIVKQGAISLGLESSKDDPAFEIAAYNLFIK